MRKLKEEKIKKVKQAKKLLYEVSLPYPCSDQKAQKNIDNTALCKREKLEEAMSLLQDFLSANE